MVDVMCMSQRDKRNLFRVIETNELEVKMTVGWEKEITVSLARE